MLSAEGIFDEHGVGLEYAMPDMILSVLYSSQSALVAKVDETAKPTLATTFFQQPFSISASIFGPSPAAALNFVSCAISVTCERNRFVDR
jgi:hypothetical protein